MPIFEGSRYASTEYTGVRGTDLITRRYIHGRNPVALEDVDRDWVVHTVVSGDELDFLAYLYTNREASKSELWWLIADINDILWPLDIEPGTDIIIPVPDLAGNVSRFNG